MLLVAMSEPWTYLGRIHVTCLPRSEMHYLSGWIVRADAPQVLSRWSIEWEGEAFQLLTSIEVETLLESCESASLRVWCSGNTHLGYYIADMKLMSISCMEIWGIGNFWHVPTLVGKAISNSEVSRVSRALKDMTMERDDPLHPMAYQRLTQCLRRCGLYSRWVMQLLNAEAAFTSRSSSPVDVSPGVRLGCSGCWYPPRSANAPAVHA